MSETQNSAPAAKAAPDHFSMEAMVDDMHRGYAIDLKACEEGVWFYLNAADLEVKVRHITAKAVQIAWNAMDESTQNRITKDDEKGRLFMAKLVGSSVICGARRPDATEAQTPTYNPELMTKYFEDEAHREARMKVWTFCQENLNYGLKEFLEESKNSKTPSSST